MNQRIKAEKIGHKTWIVAVDGIYLRARSQPKLTAKFMTRQEAVAAAQQIKTRTPSRTGRDVGRYECESIRTKSNHRFPCAPVNDLNPKLFYGG